MKMMPLTASIPAIIIDLFFHETAKAAAANAIATRLNTGVGPTFVIRATFPIALTKTNASVATARTTDDTYLEFAMAQTIARDTLNHY